MLGSLTHQSPGTIHPSFAPKLISQHLFKRCLVRSHYKRDFLKILCIILDDNREFSHFPEKYPLYLHCNLKYDSDSMPWSNKLSVTWLLPSLPTHLAPLSLNPVPAAGGYTWCRCLSTRCSLCQTCPCHLCVGCLLPPSSLSFSKRPCHAELPPIPRHSASLSISSRALTTICNLL